MKSQKVLCNYILRNKKHLSNFEPSNSTEKKLLRKLAMTESRSSRMPSITIGSACFESTNNKMIAPNPQLMISRNDMLKISMGAFLRFTANPSRD